MAREDFVVASGDFVCAVSKIDDVLIVGRAV